MGGEKFGSFLYWPFSWGSPPHGRGKDRLRSADKARRRITPAWAGKRLLSFSPAGLRWDHPRMGGEKHQDESSVMELQGSPPHGRGKACTILPFCFRCRITPAWAGKRKFVPDFHICSEDHPRMGGEKLLHLLIQNSGPGSPPHGRGKAVHPAPSSMRHRITPAWAGKSVCR